MHGVFTYLWQNRIATVLIAMLVLFSLPVGYDELKYVVLAIGIGVLGIFNYKNAIALSLSGVLLLALCGYSFLSMIWAYDPVRVVPDSFILLLAASWAILTGECIRHDSSLLLKIQRSLIIIFGVLLGLHFVGLHLDMAFTRDWHHLLAKNKNYTVSYLTILYPFLLFYNSKSQFVRFLKLASGFLLLNVIIILGVRGALVALALLIVFKIYTLWNRRVFFYFLASVVLFGAVSFGNAEFIKIASSSKLYQEYKTEKSSRSVLNRKSVDLYKGHPVLGVGAGNWWPKVHDITDVQKNTEQLHSHNLFTKKIAELGIVWLVLWLTIVVSFLNCYRKSSFKNRRSLNAAMGGLLVFFVLSSFYASVICRDDLFSGGQLICFLALGIVSNKKSNKDVLVPQKITIMSCVLIFAYFIYQVMA